MKQYRTSSKTRIAPTPSGFLHLGNVLSFMITKALAEKTGAKILLRIDDLDRERLEPRYVQDIFDTLNFLEIPWQEGPRNVQEYEQKYSQVHRLDLYNKALDQLRVGGHVFACTCTRSQRIGSDGSYPGNCLNKNLPLETPGACWRLRTDDHTELLVNRFEYTSIKVTLPNHMQYFVVKKKDGYPAYQLSSLIDDMYFGIDLIVRGQDLWPSTLAQLHLASLLGFTEFQNTTFHHHPLVTDENGEKLSKSGGATSIQYLRMQGLSAENIYKLVRSVDLEQFTTGLI